MRLAAPLLLFTTLLLGGCRPEAPTGMSREKFVRVNVALRSVPDSTPETRSRRDSILAREGVTRAQLERWVRDNASGDVLLATWREVAATLDSARPKGGAPALPPAEGARGAKDSAAIGDSTAPSPSPPVGPDSSTAAARRMRAIDEMLRQGGGRGRKPPEP